MKKIIIIFIVVILINIGYVNINLKDNSQDKMENINNNIEEESMKKRN